MSIQIPQFPELTFEEQKHIYRLNGMMLPSVTTLMKPLSEDFYDGISPDVLDRAAKRGTAIHNAVENFAQFGIEDITPEYAGYFRAFLSWWKARKPEPLATEHRVYHKVLLYAGTVDLICEIKGRLTLVDYKSSASVNSLPQCQVVNSKKDKHYQRKQSFIVLVLFLFMFSALHCSKRRTIIYSMEVRNGLYDIERGR